MKKTYLLFWTSTVILVLIEILQPALDTQGVTGRAVQLGYPAYYARALVVFKIIGVLVLLVPTLPPIIKTGAYAGFGFEFVFAFISLVATRDFTMNLVLPLVSFAILGVSYFHYQDLSAHRLLRSEYFEKHAEKRGYLKNGLLVEDIDAAVVIQWLKTEFRLATGPAIAVYTGFKWKNDQRT